MESLAARERGEREAPENSNNIRLRRAQELLELLAAAGVDGCPLRAVVPDAAALDRLGDRRVGVDRLAQGPEADALLDGDREFRDGLARVPVRKSSSESDLAQLCLFSCLELSAQVS